MSEPMQPPYPADTRAKGWRFELDYEQIEQSATWALAGPEGRPWLLMMWMTSWRQVPCGSMPADEEVIAALIGIPEKLWVKHRKALMRGWDAADDGRLYHKTVSARVLEMLDYRAKQAKRVADFKLRQREQQAANALAVGEQQASNDTGTGTGTSLKKEKKPPAAPWLTVADLVADGVGEGLASAWIAHRKAKRAVLTELAWKVFKREASKAKWTLERAIEKAIHRNWQSFEADWVAAENDGPKGAGKKPHDDLQALFARGNKL